MNLKLLTLLNASMFNRLPAGGLSISGRTISAAVIAAFFYVFAATPLMFEATSSMGLSRSASLSWYTITFLTAAVVSILLSVRYRTPFPVGWTAPGLVFLISAMSSFSYSEVAGAVLLSGVAMIVVGASGIGERLTRILPAAIVLGVFAGTIVAFVLSASDRMSANLPVVFAGLAGFALFHRLGPAWLPAVVGALVFGVAASIVTGDMAPAVLSDTRPTLEVVEPRFSTSGVIGIALPLTVLAIGTGNIPGFRVLANEGFEPRIRRVTIALGAVSIINGLFGGHSASVQGNGTVVMAGAQAGEKNSRFVSTVLASIVGLVLAGTGAIVFALLGTLPATLVPAIAGMAMLAPFANATRAVWRSSDRVSGIIAFSISSIPVSMFGINSALVALIAGLAVAFGVRRAKDQYRDHSWITSKIGGSVICTARRTLGRDSERSCAMT